MNARQIKELREAEKTGDWSLKRQLIIEDMDMDFKVERRWYPGDLKPQWCVFRSISRMPIYMPTRKAAINLFNKLTDKESSNG